MKALDTNVLVRYLVQDNATQAKAATSYIMKHCTRSQPAFINRIVLCELVWVLQSAYGYEKEQIAIVIEKILQTSQFSVENSDVAFQALACFKVANVDFADALIGVLNNAEGYSKTATFDKKAAKLDEFELLR
jgi:predicted nucleic-acid-binding protein